MERSERLATSVTHDRKIDFQIAAMRRDISEAELLRQVVHDFLDDEEIPDEVREYFLEEELEGNPKTAPIPTAD